MSEETRVINVIYGDGEGDYIDREVPDKMSLDNLRDIIIDALDLISQRVEAWGKKAEEPKASQPFVRDGDVREAGVVAFVPWRVIYKLGISVEHGHSPDVDTGIGPLPDNSLPKDETEIWMDELEGIRKAETAKRGCVICPFAKSKPCRWCEGCAWKDK